MQIPNEFSFPKCCFSNLSASFFPLKLFYMPPPSWIQLYDSHKNVSLSHFHLFVCLTFCLFLLLLLYLLFLILCSLIVFFRICCMFRILHLQQLRLSVCLIVFLFHFLVACLSDGLLFIFITRFFCFPVCLSFIINLSNVSFCICLIFVGKVWFFILLPLLWCQFALTF